MILGYLLGAPGVGGGGAPAPLTVSGLRLWLDASAITGLANAAAVTSWSDLSGNGHHAAQATSSKQPTYRTNVLNGKPVVRFDGGDCLVTASVAMGSASALTVYVVGSAGNGGNNSCFVESGANTGTGTTDWIVYRKSNNKIAAYSKGNGGNNERVSVATLTSTSTFKLITGIFDKGSGVQENAVYVSGDHRMGYDSSPVGNSNAFGDAVLNIGARNDAGSLGLTGDIAEIIVYTGAHNASQRKQVETYLNAKWNLSAIPIAVNLLFDGDSITEGGNSYFMVAYPGVVANALTDGVHWKNVAVSGQTLAQMDSDKATQVTTQYSPGLTNVLVLGGGSNDMASGLGNVSGEVASQRQIDLDTYHRGVGWTVVPIDVLPRSDVTGGAGFNTRRGVFNAAVFSAFGSRLVRLSQNTDIGEDGDSDNTTYYDADKVHPKDAGHTIIAGLVEAALGALGVT